MFKTASFRSFSGLKQHLLLIVDRWSRKRQHLQQKTKNINFFQKWMNWNVNPLIRRGSIFFFAALYCSCLGFNGLLALLTWNYCLLALPRYKGGNKGSYFKEGGQASHLIQGKSNQLLMWKNLKVLLESDIILLVSKY